MTTPQDWDPRTCNDRSGFLFQHDCDRLPVSTCCQCQKPVCESHTHYVDNEAHCISCAKRDQKEQRRAATGQRRRRQDYDHYDDPYFYGDDYYQGYGRYRPGYWGYTHYSVWSSRDSHDFTSGDAESMMHEGDGDFGYETDMSES